MLAYRPYARIWLALTGFMKSTSSAPASLSQTSAQELALSGCWTAREMGALVQRLNAVRLAPGTTAIADNSPIEALDTAGAWVLQRLL